MAEPAETRKKRLVHASRYRGQLEADLLFGRFAERELDGLTLVQLDRYEALLAENDVDLLAWIMGLRRPPARHDNDVLALLRRFEIAP